MAAKSRCRPNEGPDEATLKATQIQNRDKQRDASESHEKSQKKIEFSKQVIEVGDGTIKIRSLNGTPLKTREKSKILIENSSSLKEISEKKQAERTPSRRLCDRRSLINLNEVREIGETTGKTLKLSNRNESNDKSCKEREVSKSKNKTDKKKPKGKTLKNEVKAAKNKKILEETQSPIYLKAKKTLESCQLKPMKSETSKIKFIEKPKIKPAKLVTPKNASLGTPKGTKQHPVFFNENTQKTAVLKSLLKPSKTVDLPLQSSHSESEPGDWIDLNIEQYNGKTSDFVGEFIEKINTQQKQLKSQINKKLDLRVSIDHSTSNFSQSTADIPPAGKGSLKFCQNSGKKNESTRSNQAEKLNFKEISMRTQEDKKLSQSSRGESSKKY